MDDRLLARFAEVTAEERRLLDGGSLDMRAYKSDIATSVEGSRLLPRNQLITVRPHTRFCAFPTHGHDYVEAMYVLQGSVKHTLAGGEALTLQAGELLFLNRSAKHAIDRCGEGDVAVNFIVRPEFFDFALEMVGADNALGRFLLDALRSGESDVPYLYFRIADDASVQHLLQSMLYGFVEQRDGQRRVSRIEMGLLFLHLLSRSDRMQLSTAMRNWNNLAVELLGAIRRRYVDFSLKDFADGHGVSSAYLSRIAREATGMSCTELLQQRRMEKARQLLRDTRQSVLSVSQSVGYSNSSYFYRLFERLYGVSPTRYRGSQRT